MHDIHYSDLRHISRPMGIVCVDLTEAGLAELADSRPGTGRAGRQQTHPEQVATDRRAGGLESLLLHLHCEIN